jgi:nuclear-control-of-ATPase protein 2
LDDVARAIGTLAYEGPRWSQWVGERRPNTTFSGEDITAEANRIWRTVGHVLEVSGLYGCKRSHSAEIASPRNLLSILQLYLPEMQASIQNKMNTHSRPSPLTRLWFPLLFLPPALWTAANTFSRNQQWLKDQMHNGRETVEGFFVQWVWEPLEDIGKTMRGGGEGLGVSSTTVHSDQEVRLWVKRVMIPSDPYSHYSGWSWTWVETTTAFLAPPWTTLGTRLSLGIWKKF